MKYLDSFLLAACFKALVCTLMAACAATDVKRFIVVSDWDVASEMYLRINRTISPPSQNDELETKRQICIDVIRSHLFHHPDDDKNAVLGTEEEPFDFATEPIRVKLFTGGFATESAFVCMTMCGDRLMKYYISEEYDLSAIEGYVREPGEYFAARFIFWSSTDANNHLVAIAELPAVILSGPDVDIEYLYLQRRQGTRLYYPRREDALCKLSDENKERICLATFNSDHFQEKVNLPNSDAVKGSCALKNVSFRTKHKKTEGPKVNYRQWMMGCRKADDEIEHKYDYLLSHAYESNEIIVYFWDRVTGEIYPENLSTNVRIEVEKWRYRPPKDAKEDDEVAPAYSDEEWY